MFEEQFGKEVAREPEAIADAVGVHFASAREQLTELQRLLVRLPGKAQPKQLEQLEKALEDCRRKRQVDPTLTALKRHLTLLGDGLTELRRLRTDVTEDVVRQVKDAQDFAEIYLTQLEAQMAGGHVEASAVSHAATLLRDGLGSPRPWEAAQSLRDSVQELRAVYVKRRSELLASHGARIEDAVKGLKLRDGFDTLGQDEQHQVLSLVREGASFDTKVDAPVPSLSDLEAQSRVRIRASVEKALGRLDELREAQGVKPTVTVALGVSGREIETEEELERFLDEVRQQVLQELRAGRRARLR
jgi:hypothetical protein